MLYNPLSNILILNCIYFCISSHLYHCSQSHMPTLRLQLEFSICTTLNCEKPRLPIISSVQSSHSVVSNSLWPHGQQHARLPCPSSTPRTYSDSCPLSRWCHPTISSSVIPFSSRFQSFPALGSFQMSQFFTSGGQSIGVSASTPVLPMDTQDWPPLGWYRALILLFCLWPSPARGVSGSVCRILASIKLNLIFSCCLCLMSS